MGLPATPLLPLTRLFTLTPPFASHGHRWLDSTRFTLINHLGTSAMFAEDIAVPRLLSNPKVVSSGQESDSSLAALDRARVTSARKIVVKVQYTASPRLPRPPACLTTLQRPLRLAPRPVSSAHSASTPPQLGVPAGRHASGVSCLRRQTRSGQDREPH